MTHVRARKTVVSDAIMVTTAEDEQEVQGWLEEMGYPHQDLAELIEQHVWFVRDPGTTIVYLVHPADFAVDWENVEEDDPEESLGFNPADIIAEFEFKEDK